MGLNLPPPPGFRGLNPQRPIEIYQRRLPHWRQAGAIYFVTFHLADAMPATKRRQLEVLRREWRRRNPDPDAASVAAHAREIFRHVEAWIDAGAGACWFRRPQYAAELRRALLCQHGARYELGCFVNMANHCHAVIRPFDQFRLEREVGVIKRLAAGAINEAEGLEGRLWQQESYDRIIRDEEHLWKVIQYIGANPRRAGVPAKQWDRWINPEWEALGWSFVDERSNL
ncbi:MAG: hypothetical protein CMJ58_21520 [Planctomycetaceae bacterium]|nr:hypothetical protein [Planctomycetaceae bacterium]